MITLQGRAILIRDMLTVVPVYNMSLYKWPVGVIRELERLIKNFINSRSLEIAKNSGAMGLYYQTLFRRGHGT